MLDLAHIIGGVGGNWATGGPTLDIVVINLASAQERRLQMIAQLQSLPHDWSFFEAHTTLRHPDLQYDAQAVRRSFGRSLSVQELAIWSSHYTVVTRFLETSTSDYLLVLEDDVILDTAVPLPDILEVCRKRDLHYLRLFGMYDAPAHHLSYFFSRSIIRYRSSPSGLQAYVLSREGARRIARSCRRIETAVDLAFDRFWKTGLPIYAVFPFPVIERFSPSSNVIGPDARMGRLERLGLIRARIWRRLCKLWGNAALIGADARFRNSAAGFRQIRAEHVAGPDVPG